MNEDFAQMKRELEELKAWKKSLEMSHSIPLNIDQAFRARFAFGLTTSSKSASSENRAVDEGGSATYSVLTTPDAFLQITINNTVYYIPVFT